MSKEMGERRMKGCVLEQKGRNEGTYDGVDMDNE